MTCLTYFIATIRKYFSINLLESIWLVDYQGNGLFIDFGWCGVSKMVESAGLQGSRPENVFGLGGHVVCGDCDILAKRDVQIISQMTVSLLRIEMLHSPCKARVESSIYSIHNQLHFDQGTTAQHWILPLGLSPAKAGYIWHQLCNPHSSPMGKVNSCVWILYFQL